jgi:hypothetical protein
MFAEMDASRVDLVGYSGTWGSFVFVTRVWQVTDGMYDFHLSLAETAAHEVTHLLMDTNDQNGFDDEEHEHNPDPHDPAESPLDKKYLMYFRPNAENWEQIIFSQGVRSQLDLTSKESVERK